MSDPVTPWTGACQTPLFMKFLAKILKWVAISFSRESSGPGIKPGSLALQANSLPFEPPGKPKYYTDTLTKMNMHVDMPMNYMCFHMKDEWLLCQLPLDV